MHATNHEAEKTTYLNIFANVHPQKEVPHCIRFTVGGDRLDYPGPNATIYILLTTIGGSLVLNRLPHLWLIDGNYLFFTKTPSEQCPSTAKKPMSPAQPSPIRPIAFHITCITPQISLCAKKQAQR